MSSFSVFPSQQQRSALAELDAALGRGERNRAEQLTVLEQLAKAGRGASVASAWLRRTDDYLDRLRRNRQLLLSAKPVLLAGEATTRAQS